MLIRYGNCFLFFVVIALLQWNKTYAFEKPFIFPLPSDMQIKQGSFFLDEKTFLLLAGKSGTDDQFLTSLLRNEIADKYQYTIKTTGEKKLPEKFILIGSIADPLVKNYCVQNGLLASLQKLGDEGYILSVTEKNVVIASNTREGTLYGVESLRQIIKKQNGQILLPQLLVKDAPRYPFRGIKLYLPGKENISFLKRFIKDFVAFYKFNKIILELNANMRLDRHPELNIGAVQFARHLNFSRLDRPPGVHMEYQNSSHQDNADGQILEKEDVADLVRYMRKFNIEVIPELPSLTHSYYLLAGHEELAENLNQPYPDTYCPLKPEIYKIYFDVLDEYIDVIHPSMIHVGHDEWRMEKDLCELCRGKDYGALYAMDLKKIHDYLAAKGIGTAIWGDHLLESVTEKDHQTWKSSTGYQYKIPGALKPEQVLKLIPKDIIVFNWFWDQVANDRQLSEFGFKQVYGNLRADIADWNERKNIKGVLGGAPSSWAATMEKNIGKDQLIDFLGAASLLWSKSSLSQKDLVFEIEPLINEVYQNLSGKILPGDLGSQIAPIDLSSAFNSSLQEATGDLKTDSILSGDVQVGNQIFQINSSKNKNVVIVDQDKKMQSAIAINKDVNSLIFLHACTREAINNKAYGMIYNFDDTADPLGYYEVVYDDGMVEIIPVRYGVNVLDWNWRQRISGNEKAKAKYSQNQYAYNARAVNCSKDSSRAITFFSYEWQNPRFGKKIKEVNLKTIDRKKNDKNSIIVLAVSVSETKRQENAKGTEAQ
jgi:hypothetical protein